MTPRRVPSASAAHPPEALCPPVAVSVLVPTLLGLFLVSIYGLIFSLLAKFAWGRRLLLANPSLFSGGVFTHEGPSKAQLAEATFTTTLLAYPMPNNSDDKSSALAPASSSPLAIAISGPEPGYVATPKIVLSLAATLLFAAKRAPPAPKTSAATLALESGNKKAGASSRHRSEPYALARTSGCCTPAALLGSGAALDAFVSRLEAVGIVITGVK